jgi:Icc-related predicted phosphoesterase
MDTNSFSHRGLKLIKEFIESASPKYFLHGHLHNPWEEKFIETKIIQVYKTYILNLNW